jgi:hypothetical protein
MGSELRGLTVSAIVILLLAGQFSLALGDRGMILPPYFFVEEPGQKAIIAWNGQEEVLILSTDLTYRWREIYPTPYPPSITILEVLPLPSVPRVKLGTFQSFRSLARMISERILEERAEPVWRFALGVEVVKGVELVFQDQIGPHNLTVVKVNSVNDFVEWVDEFFSKRNLPYSISPEFEDAVRDYVFRNITYFAFDVIEAEWREGTYSWSVEPLIYKFKSDALYYPFKITFASDIGGVRSRVNLFLITKGIVDSKPILNSGLSPEKAFSFYELVSVPQFE